MTDILGGSPEEVIEAYVHAAMAGSDEMPLCEFMTFSGAATDWRKDGNHVLLRLTGRHCDDAGQPYEVWARLVAPAGRWVIPTVPTEMQVVCPPHLWRMAGVAWAIHGAQLPPGKVDQETAYEDLGDGVTLLQKMGGWALKTAAGTVMGIDRDTGDVQITHASGARFVVGDGVIEFMVPKDGDLSQVATVLRVDRDGVRLASNGKIATQWDGTNGKFTQVGADGCYLAHPGGVLGPAGNFPVTYGAGAGSLASVTWKIAG